MKIIQALRLIFNSLNNKINALDNSLQNVRNYVDTRTNTLENMLKGCICFNNVDTGNNITAYKYEDGDLHFNPTTYFCYKDDETCYYVAQLASGASVFSYHQNPDIGLIQVGVIDSYMLSLEQLNTIIQAR